VSLGSFISPSPLNATNVDSTLYGDHGRQVEIPLPAYVSPKLQQSYGGEGDACHMSEDAAYEFRSLQSVSRATFVSHASDVGIPTLPAANIFSSLEMELTGKPVQPQEKSGSSAAVMNLSKQESGDADQTLSHVTTLSQTIRNMLPTSVSSTDKHLNWETLFMPYRRRDDAVQMLQHEPVVVAKETGNQAPVNLATVLEGFSVSGDIRQYSESDIARPDRVDNASMDNTSVWVISCEISLTDVMI